MRRSINSCERFEELRYFVGPLPETGGKIEDNIEDNNEESYVI
jgi:hypothetical protein